MDSDIEFGDVQEAIPEKSLRPDRNAHYAIVEYENPQASELPIFIDLDVFRDMEEHAASDKTVELGGVLLGGQYHDADGKAFVVITDSLRAEHFEATKGSFKFTHETWSQINRQRNEFPPELQMVGWYHTHPDWGVFLSGMDMFICDHFFNKPLDVAYVIDPCRNDRAMFQWTGNARERVRRTGGFYVMASRYRAAELASTVAQTASGVDAMPGDPRQHYSGMMAPVVNVTQPGSSQYQNLAIIGMLSIQACLLMLIAWKMLAPAEVATKGKDEQVAKLEKRLEAIDAQKDQELRMAAQTAVLDRVMTELKGEPRGLVNALEEREKNNAELRAALRGQDALNAKLKEEKEKAELSLANKNDKLEREQAATKETAKQLKEVEAKLAALQTKFEEATESKETEKAAATDYTWYWVGGTVAAVLAIGGLIATFVPKQSERDTATYSGSPVKSSESLAQPTADPVANRADEQVT